jgi:HEAT repeat protein
MAGTLPGGSMPKLPENVADEAREALLRDAATLAAEARTTVLNAALRDGERAVGLLRLRLAAPPPAFDDATLTAALQLGTSSRDEYARETAWYALRGVTDPSIVQPLLHSLANDTVDDVRSAAALALGPFAERPEVREALTRAAAEVPPEVPEVSLGEFTVRTVRLAARLALRAGDEPNEAVRKTVLDESLTPRERLVLLPPSDLSPRRLDELGDEAARAVFALGSSSDDNGVRARAWSLLGYVRVTDFVPALLADLARHPAESIRAAAATGLTQHRDDPDIRAALDRALADPSLAVQRAARNALDGARGAF